MMNTGDIAAALKQMRIAKSLLQKDIGAALGVDTSTVTHIERGTRLPSIDVLFKWLDVCGGTIQILGPGSMPDALTPLLAAAAKLSDKDQARLQEVAELLPKVDEMSKGSAIAGLRWAAGPEWAAERGR